MLFMVSCLNHISSKLSNSIENNNLKLFKSNFEFNEVNEAFDLSLSLSRKMKLENSDNYSLIQLELLKRVNIDKIIKIIPMVIKKQDDNLLFCLVYYKIISSQHLDLLNIRLLKTLIDSNTLSRLKRSNLSLVDTIIDNIISERVIQAIVSNLWASNHEYSFFISTYKGSAVEYRSILQFISRNRYNYSGNISILLEYFIDKYLKICDDFILNGSDDHITELLVLEACKNIKLGASAAINIGSHRIIQKYLDSRIYKEFNHNQAQDTFVLSEIAKVVDINQGYLGETLLMSACRSGNKEIFDILYKISDAGIIDKQGITTFMYACRGGNLEIVKALINYSNINSKDATGKTPFIFSILGENIEVMSLLLEHGVNINQTDKDGKTPFMYSISTNNIGIMNFLLKRGANINSLDIHSTTALKIAVIKNNKKIAKYLLEKYAYIDRGSLIYACSEGSVEILDCLLSAFDINSDIENGKTLLMFASYKGRVKHIEYLVKKGADMSRHDKNENTAMLYALLNDKMEALKALLDLGANIEIRHKNRGSLLFNAAIHNKIEALKLLISRGAKIDSLDSLGQTPLMVAASNGHEDIVDILIEAGASIDKKDRYGWTPFFFAASGNNKNIMDKMALSIDFRDINGNTPLIILSENSKADLIHYLILKGADINAQNEFGYTALHLATIGQNIEVVKVLIKHGVQFQKNIYGQSPLLFAEYSGNENLCDLLSYISK